MKLFVSRTHLLHIVVPYTIATDNLRSLFGCIGVHICNDRFFACLVVYNGGTLFTLKDLTHLYSRIALVCLIERVERLGLDLSFLALWVVKGDGSHLVDELFGVF